MATATSTIANNAPNHAANHPTPHAAPRGGHNAPAPVAPPTSAYPSDDEILGIVDEPNSGENPRDRSFGANAPSREAHDANTAPQDDATISDAAQNSNAPSAAMPEWLARVSAADPAAAPELAALWNRSSALETFDRAVYGGDPSARQQLVTQLYSDDPAALRALVATATQLLAGSVAQVVPSDLGPLSDTGRDSLLSSPANSPFGSRDTSPSAPHSAAWASNIPRSDEPTWATKPPHDPAPADRALQPRRLRAIRAIHQRRSRRRRGPRHRARSRSHVAAGNCRRRAPPHCRRHARGSSRGAARRSPARIASRGRAARFAFR